MPTLTVRKDVEFHYTDSGPIPNTPYTTVIIIHGHTFHNGTLLELYRSYKLLTQTIIGIFQRTLPIASAHSLRVICVNRREYPGSSPYTAEELRVIAHGCDAERKEFLHQEGILFALFIDGLIQQLSLPKEGGVAVAGWSLGTVLSFGVLSSIHDLPEDTQGRLKTYIRSFILWGSFSVLDYSSSPVGNHLSNQNFLSSRLVLSALQGPIFPSGMRRYPQRLVALPLASGAQVSSSTVTLHPEISPN